MLICLEFYAPLDLFLSFLKFRKRCGLLSADGQRWLTLVLTGVRTAGRDGGDGGVITQLGLRHGNRKTSQGTHSVLCSVWVDYMRRRQADFQGDGQTGGS